MGAKVKGPADAGTRSQRAEHRNIVRHHGRVLHLLALLAFSDLPFVSNDKSLHLRAWEAHIHDKIGIRLCHVGSGLKIELPRMSINTSLNVILPKCCSHHYTC